MAWLSVVDSMTHGDETMTTETRECAFDCGRDADRLVMVPWVGKDGETAGTEAEAVCWSCALSLNESWPIVELAR